MISPLAGSSAATGWSGRALRQPHTRRLGNGGVRIAFDHLAVGQDVLNIGYGDAPLEHSTQGMQPEHQASAHRYCSRRRALPGGVPDDTVPAPLTDHPEADACGLS